MSKSFEQLPDFNSRIELVTYLRLLAQDIEDGNIDWIDYYFSKSYNKDTLGILFKIETLEKRL